MYRKRSPNNNKSFAVLRRYASFQNVAVNKSIFYANIALVTMLDSLCLHAFTF